MTSLKRLVFALIVSSLLAAMAVSVSGAETDPAYRDDSDWPVSAEAEDSPAAFEGTIVNRSFGRGGPGVPGPVAQSGTRAKSNPELNTSFEGINLFQHRYANNQNQLTIGQILLLPPPPPPQSEGTIDSNDSRMQQVWYANGKLWGALDTALTLDRNRAGIEYFIVNPAGSNVAAASLKGSGYLGLSGNNLTYPAIATTPSGRGVMAFTIVGDDYYPSAGYASIDDKTGAGDIHVAALGAGPDDGFTIYPPLANPARGRWGDYGAAVLDGKSIWIASEYIAQTCTFDQYIGQPGPDGNYGRLANGFGLCNNTRGSSANWSTRITKLTP